MTLFVPHSQQELIVGTFLQAVLHRGNRLLSTRSALTVLTASDESANMTM
jgi:hypothetical protein